VLVAGSVPVKIRDALVRSQKGIFLTFNFFRRSIMSKKLFILISFVLVLGLVGGVSAQDANHT